MVHLVHLVQAEAVVQWELLVVGELLGHQEVVELLVQAVQWELLVVGVLLVQAEHLELLELLVYYL